jgi:hypothetical protein
MTFASYSRRARPQSRSTSPAQRTFDFDAISTSAVLLGERVREPVLEFAERFAVLLQVEPQARFDNVAISRLAKEVFGAAAGHARDMYDAVEAGFNLYLDRLGLILHDVAGTLERLRVEGLRLPAQSRRDQEQIDFQQFSTPHAEAFLMVKAAALKPGMEVLEPSAGTGNIAVLARSCGAKVHTNEIHPRRIKLLTALGFSLTTHDAERLDNLLVAEKSFHAVVMNPPFSATGGRVVGHRTEFGARHVEQALLRLRPGGRLVALVGRGMEHHRPGFLAWWQEVSRRFAVRANVGIDGKEYARFGTIYDHQLIVIDHTGPRPQQQPLITGVGLSIEAAFKVLENVSKEDVYERVLEKTKQRGSQLDERTVSQGSGTGSERASSAHRGSDGSGQSTSECEFPHERPVVHLEPACNGPGGGTPRCAGHDLKRGSLAAPHEYAIIEELGREPGDIDARPIEPALGKLEATTVRAAVQIEPGTVYSSYRVQKALLRGAHPHPANVVESTAMACVEPPDIRYRPSLPPELILEGRVSSLQLEDVIYAGQATSVFLPDGSRKGHWNGDGTGIGKGREIYAFFYEQYMQGFSKHVHISASHQLCADAERDRSAVGLPLAIVHQADYKTGATISGRSGVLFTTYTLLSHDFDGERPRFQQLLDWLGPDFEGVVAFDEAHLMKNAAAIPHGGKATVDQGTLRGNMGIALQRTFPRARVRYFSATGATEARHMAPYERLGLWGAGAPFADFSAFLVAMERGGVAAMEMLCRDLKSVGTYLSRTISYGPTRREDGSIVPDSAVEYEPLVHRLTENERRQYDAIADLWQELLVAFESAEKNACMDRNAHRYAQFYAAQQRFFLQLMLTFTLPDVLPAIEQDLAAGRSVVLSLFNTGEAQTDRKVRAARADGIPISELDATPREMIAQLIEKQFPLYQYQEQTDPMTGTVARVRVEDAAGNPEINRENERRQQELLEKVADLDFPQNPLDTIMAHFGAANVAEISGRSHRFENGKYVRRKLDGVPPQKLNVCETRLFQQGQKKIAVISGAGSTGISVHADVEAKNKCRRVFYAFQLSWSADQQMQAFGRVHRSHQVSAPVIRLVLLDLAGQKRLVNAVSKRLAALGALTKGERHSLASDLFRPEDVTDMYGKAALAKLYREIETGRHSALGLGLKLLERMGVLNAEKSAVRDSFTGNVEQFLNRIMVLHVKEQNQVFELFYERYLLAVETAKKQSAFDFGVEEIRANNLRRVGMPETLYVDPGSGARTLLHELEGEVDVPRQAYTTVADREFFQNKKSGRIYAAVPFEDEFRQGVYLTAVKGSRRFVEAYELSAKYDQVEPEVARIWWNREYDKTPATESRRYHLLSGAIFPIYDKVMGHTGIESVRIARAILADGQALVGLNLSESDVPRVKERLGIGTPLKDATAREILAVVAGGGIVELDNGWRLRTGHVARERVLELLLQGVSANPAELVELGFVGEIIRFKRRWFVIWEEAEPVAERLFLRHKAVRDVTVSARGSQGVT